MLHHCVTVLFFRLVMLQNRNRLVVLKMPLTFEGHKYFQILIDDYSHFVVVKFLKTKDEAEQNIIDFVKLIKTQHGYRTKKIRCDNGGEYSSNYFRNLYRSKGIELQYTMPYSPQQNGTSERMNITLMDKVRTKFAETYLPKELWGEAIRCSVYELNRSPTSANDGIPLATRWYGKNNLSNLRVFGSRAWMVKLPKHNKLDSHAEPFVMVGYYGGGYQLWDSKENKITCSRDISFDEKNVKYNKREDYMKVDERNTEI